MDIAFEFIRNRTFSEIPKPGSMFFFQYYFLISWLYEMIVAWGNVPACSLGWNLLSMTEWATGISRLSDLLPGDLDGKMFGERIYCRARVKNRLQGWPYSPLFTGEILGSSRDQILNFNRWTHPFQHRLFFALLFYSFLFPLHVLLPLGGTRTLCRIMPYSRWYKKNVVNRVIILTSK